MSSNFAIHVDQLAKAYHQYSKPSDRIKQMLLGRYKNFYSEYHALKPLSFEVEHGQVLGLVGQNGAGKSTLLQLICGTLQPSSGSVTVNGRIAALLELGSGFNPEFTGRENVFLNASILGLSQKETQEKYDSIVEFSGIGDFIEQPVKTYSSGMLVRLAFSVATSVEPNILIIDEALSVGDGAFARKSFDRIMSLKENGCTILFCSHSLYQVEKLCDQVIWLNKGEMVASGNPSVTLPHYQAFLDGAEPDAIKQKDSEKLAPSPAKNGHLSARINNVTITVDGNSNPPFTVKSQESNIKIHVDTLFDPNLPTPGVGVTFYTMDGRIVSSAASWEEGIELTSTKPGHGQCSIEFSQIALLKGHYKIGIYLFCERGIHNYEYFDPAAEFSVTQKNSEQGLVHLTRKWGSYDG